MKKKRIKAHLLIARQFPEWTDKESYTRIMCGKVKIGGETVRNRNAVFSEDAPVEYLEREFVSRGGKKLQGALDAWKVDVKDRVLLDAGSSTGGFTDCLLQYGARAVHAVDVGFNQLDYRLRTDSRVLVHEKTNIMALESLEPPPVAAVADLSFRSIVHPADRILTLCNDSWLIGLIKPQFEWENPDADFDGIIRDSSVLAEILLKVARQFAEKRIGWKKIMPSTLTGKKGNQEFLVWMERGDDPIPEESIREICRNL